MLAKCIRECYDGPTGIKYYLNGGVNNDGMFDVDPLSPLAQYFEFPVGTKKYHKIAGSKKEGKQPIETTVTVGGEPEGPTKKEVMAQLDALGIEYKPIMHKAELMALIPKNE
jgi:hypothetical protein